MAYVPGSSASLIAEWRTYFGGPLVAVTGVTITITNAVTGAVAVGPTATGVLYPMTGLNTYAWDIPPGLVNGNYIVTWTTSTGATATELITVQSAAAYAVTLAEVKLHANITSNANDAELLNFISTAQSMVESEVGITVQRSFTETHRPRPSDTLYLNQTPLASITSVTDLGGILDATSYTADLDAGSVRRKTGYRWYSLDNGVTVTYVAGRAVIPEGVKWAIKELTTHLWRSTQTQRGGRARGDGDVASGPAAYGMPNRVHDALIPFLREPVVA